MHPVSTATRPVRLFIAENGIKCDEEMVDILKGAHYQEPYASLNPNRMVPMLEDADSSPDGKFGHPKVSRRQV
jgi:glutathione S-transferase